jgi:hypothetical protein
MTEQEKDMHEYAIKTYAQQLHLTVIYEQNFLQNLGSLRALLSYRDDILDRINARRRILGRI